MAGHSRNDAGEVIGTEGFYVDVTRSIEEHQTTITEAIRNRQAPIHHRTGKGVLMMVYGIDADAAFHVLKWCSQNSPIKLRLFLIADVRGYTPFTHTRGVTVSTSSRLSRLSPRRDPGGCDGRRGVGSR